MLGFRGFSYSHNGKVLAAWGLAENQPPAGIMPAPRPLQTVLGGGLEIARSEASMLCDAGEHARTYLFGVVEGEHVVGPSLSGERPVRPALALNAPADTSQ